MFTLSIILLSKPIYSRLLREEVSLLLNHFGADQESMRRAQSIITEAFSNVIRHAYDEHGGVCKVKLAIDEQKLVIRVADWGVGFNAEQSCQVSPWQESGRGLYFIQSMADNVKIESTSGSGTVLAIEVNLRVGHGSAVNTA